MTELPINDGYRKLALTIIAQAEQDYRDRSKRTQVRQFVDSPWLEFLCTMLEIDYEKTKQAIIEGWGNK